MIKYSDLKEIKPKLEPLINILNSEILNLELQKENIEQLKKQYISLKKVRDIIRYNNFDMMTENKNIALEYLKCCFDENDIAPKLFEKIIIKYQNDKYAPYTLLGELKTIVNKKLYEIRGQLYLQNEKEITNKIDIYKSTKNNIKTNAPIKPYQYAYIKKLLVQKNFPSSDMIEIFIKIETYNNVIFGKDKYMGNEGIEELLKTGFEQFSNIDLGETENNNIEKHIGILFKNCSDCLDNYELFKLCLPQNNNQTYNEKKYTKIYYDFMKKIQKQLLEYTEMLKSEEFYFNKEFRTEILTEYKKWTAMYVKCRKFFEEQLAPTEIIQVEKQEEPSIKTRFVFSKSLNGTFFERDLKDVPEQYLERVMKLLNDKRYDTLGETEDEQLRSHEDFKKFRELRDDQIRIIYKNQPNNFICIYGIGVKKTDKDILMYRRLTQRPDNNELIEDIDSFNRIMEYCEQTKRKGNR